MPQIDVTVADKNYVLSCAEGDESRLRDMVSMIDEKASSLRGKLGHISESRMLLMTAVMIADELRDTQDAMQELSMQHLEASAQLESMTENTEKYTPQMAGYSDEELAVIIEQIAMEVEGIAHSLTTE